eukprot:2718309-Amphidinium_carterae.2
MVAGFVHTKPLVIGCETVSPQQFLVAVGRFAQPWENVMQQSQTQPPQSEWLRYRPSSTCHTVCIEEIYISLFANFATGPLKDAWRWSVHTACSHLVLLYTMAAWLDSALQE